MRQVSEGIERYAVSSHVIYGADIANTKRNHQRFDAQLVRSPISCLSIFLQYWSCSDHQHHCEENEEDRPQPPELRIVTPGEMADRLYEHPAPHSYH